MNTMSGQGRPPIEAERKAAEHEYITTSFNYPEAPVGSRDWTLYWAGWLARSTHALASSVAKPEAQEPTDAQLASVIRGMEALTHIGWAPDLRYDDDGHWKIVADTFCELPWSDTPLAAWKQFVEVRLKDEPEAVAALATPLPAQVQPAEQVGPDRQAWLIEDQDHFPRHRWLRIVDVGKEAYLQWEYDANRATHFARRDDAVAFQKLHLNFCALSIVTGHTFLGAIGSTDDPEAIPDTGRADGKPWLDGFAGVKVQPAYEPTAAEVTALCARTGMSPVTARETLTEEKLQVQPAEQVGEPTSDEAMRLAIVRTWNINYCDVTQEDIAAWRAGRAKPAQQQPVSADTRDAARYRFLRDNHYITSPILHAVTYYTLASDTDEAVDALMDAALTPPQAPGGAA